MRVALVVAPNWSTLTPPLGAAILKSSIQVAGHSARVFDLNALCSSRADRHQKRLWKDRKFWSDKKFFDTFLFPSLEPDIDETVESIARWNPSVVGFTLLATSMACCLKAAEKIRARLPEAKIIFGGPSMDRTELEKAVEIYRSLVDVVVFGEGEDTLEDLLSRWALGRSLDGCAGIAHFSPRGEWIFEETRPTMKMERVPAPDFSDVDWNLYEQKVLPIMMSRGCVAKCTFCAETRYWKIFRYRDAESVFWEMKTGLDQYGIGEFEFNDSLINGNFKVLQELVDLLNEAQLKLRWQGYARLDRRMTPDLLDKMAAAGCQTLRFGFESGSQKVTDLMEKRTNVEQARQIVRECSRAGIRSYLQVIVGYPGEAEEDFQKTLDFIEENAEFIGAVSPNPMMITPDLPMSRNPRKYGIRDDIEFLGGNWESVDGLNTLAVRRARMSQILELLARKSIGTDWE